MMDFITTDQRIAVENFTIGNIYTITFRNAIYFSGSCIGKGADFVSFQRTAPELSFVLTMQTAPTVLLITEGGGGTGTTDYNNLSNKPSINGVTLQGSLSLADLGIASADDLSALERDVDDLTENQGIDRAALVELVDGGAKNIADISQTTFTSTTKNGVTVTLSGDTYTVSGTGGTSTNNFFSVYYAANTIMIPSGTWVFAIFGENLEDLRIEVSDNVSPDVQRGNYGDTVFIATIPEGITRSYMRICTKAGADFTTNATFKIMICLPAAWDISQAYQPYRPSYQELWDIVKAL